MRIRPRTRRTQEPEPGSAGDSHLRISTVSSCGCAPYNAVASVALFGLPAVFGPVFYRARRAAQVLSNP